MESIEDRLLEAIRELTQKQTDALFQGMQNLSETQTKALARAINQALQTQTDQIVAALNSYVVRIYHLERAVSELREGRAAEERGSLQ
jgi:hypothetical protein